MAIVGHPAIRRRSDRKLPRYGVTLVELLVVVGIVGVLAALLLPALNGARASSRRTACQANLKQLATGLMARAQTHGTLCSGAFDWYRDGCVTEVGWVADLVNSEIPVGQMLCPSNPHRLSEAYNDLLTIDTTTFDDCVDRLGSPPEIGSDGSVTLNPCRFIVENSLAPCSAARVTVVEEQIYEKDYNTNYTAS